MDVRSSVVSASFNDLFGNELGYFVFLPFFDSENEKQRVILLKYCETDYISVKRPSESDVRKALFQINSYMDISNLDAFSRIYRYRTLGKE